MALLGKMAVLFLYILLGYICCKRKLLDKEASKLISFIVLNMASPALNISGAVNRTGEVEGGLMPTVIAAILMYVGLILLAFVIPPLLRVPRKDTGIYRLMTIFSNIGFMGFPVVQAMFGTNALLQVAVFQIPYNLLIYTYGIFILTSGKGGEEGKRINFEWKKMINIGVISSLITIAIYVSGLKTPVFFNEAMEGLGNLTAPLSMLVIGIALAQIPLRNLFTDVRLLIFAALKLIVIPVIAILIIKQFLQDEILLGILMVMLATPVGSMTAMLAQQYGGDTELTSRGVALTTLLSVITIPIVGMIVL